MKNYIFILLSINIFLPFDTQAAKFQLYKISQQEFEVVTSKISKAIESDDNKIEVLPFDLVQTFSVSSNDKKIGYLIPVKFNSKSFKNTICRLYFLDTFANVQYVKLFAEKNDDEDIVTSCINIEAVSIKSNETDLFDYFAIIRTRLANTYRSTGAVVSFNKNSIIYNEKLNSCIQNGKPIPSINILKQKNVICSKKLQSF